MTVRAVRVRSAAALGLVVLLVAATHALADKKAKPPKGKKAETASVTVTFTTSQRDAARGWYAEKYGRGNCPPGLAKKNNGCLPPGQAKKRYAIGHPLPAGVAYGPPPPDLAARIGPPPSGYLYVSLDGDLLKLAAGTLLVVDAVDGLVH
jgi:hypothetical protein